MARPKSAPASRASAPVPDPAAVAPPSPAPVHQVLSRKYRPQGFGELRGQEHVARILGNALASGRVGHAYLFVGPRGVGKTTTARIFARALNCTGRPAQGPAAQGPSERGAATQGAATQGAATQGAATQGAAAGVEPCGTCPSCRDIAAGVDLDVVEIDGASNSGVEDVRALREQVGYAAVRARYRIWIVDEVHMLSLPAFNAFLKTLEEPPPKVKFIFCTTEEHKLPDTFRSRCQRVDFRPIAERSIAERLADLAAREGVAVEEGLCDAIARGALGGLRDAESLLEQLLAAAVDGKVTIADLDALSGRAPAALLEGLRTAVAGGDAAAALEAVDACFAAGGKPGVLLDQWLDTLRRDLLEAARAAPGAGRSVARVARSIDVLLAKRAHLRAGADGVLVAQVAAVELARLPEARDLDRLIEALAGGAPGGAVAEPAEGRRAGGPPPRAGGPPPRAAGAAPRGGGGAAGSGSASPPPPAEVAARSPGPADPGSGPSEAATPGVRWAALVARADAEDPRLAAILRRIEPGPLEDDGRTWRLTTPDAMARTAFDRREIVLSFRRIAREALGREVAPRVVAAPAGSGPSAGPSPSGPPAPAPPAGAPAPRARVSPREAREHPAVRLVTEATDGTLLDVRTESDEAEESR